MFYGDLPEANIEAVKNVLFRCILSFSDVVDAAALLNPFQTC